MRNMLEEYIKIFWIFIEKNFSTNPWREIILQGIYIFLISFFIVSNPIAHIINEHANIRLDLNNDNPI